MRIKPLILATVAAAVITVGASQTLSQAPAETPASNTPPTTVKAVRTHLNARKKAPKMTIPPIVVPEDALCPQWWPLAVRVGWPVEELEMLDFIIWRESRCDPNAWNGHDAGLTQINQIHTEFVAVMGWSWPEDMFKPEPSLRFTLKLWQGKGWEPWGY